MASKKKTPKRRVDIERPYCDGKWSLARMRQFIMSALRRAQWPPKYASIERTFTRDGINPKTGRKCKLHRCEHCHGEFPKGEMKADHIYCVIPLLHDWGEREGSWLGYDWNEVMRRLWVERDGFQILCEKCHQKLTNEEREARKTEWNSNT